MKCGLHVGCTLPCPIEAALHLEIAATSAASHTRLREAARRRGKKLGGYHGSIGPAGVRRAS